MVHGRGKEWEVLSLGARERELRGSNLGVGHDIEMLRGSEAGKKRNRRCKGRTEDLKWKGKREELRESELRVKVGWKLKDLSWAQGRGAGAEQCVERGNLGY